MYPLLRRGDRLPSVAAVQVLINRKMRRGVFITVDGIYGPKTRQAVYAFQEEHHLGRDGVVGKNTWPALIRGEGLTVIDSVDVTNPKDMGYEDAAIRQAGGDPIVNFGMCNGVKVVVTKIMGRGKTGGVVLLRFHGHGSPGSMGITVGTGNEISSEFGTRFLDSLARYLQRRLAFLFPSFGSVELHGCRVGKGADGQRLCQALAQAFGVPVTAGTKTQYGGGLSTFRFEGPTYTAFPAGKDLKSWARSLPVPEIHGMSVFR